MRANLQALQARYTEEHPDIIAVKSKIAKAEKLKKQMESEIATDQKTSRTKAGADTDALGDVKSSTSISMIQVQSQLKANQMEILNDQQRERDIESQISSYQSRLNLTPETEQELTNISRGYEESKLNYTSLQQKQMQSQLATSLQHQQGEQFRVIDPPSFPVKPSSPNHLWLSLGGLAVGICIGLGLAAVLELMDARVRQEKDFESILPVRVLVGIPRLNTPREDHLLILKKWTELGAATALVLLIVLGNMYSFYKG
jgi:uncharacterized protein involved in exopolysaccharide biosynthesis